MQHSQFTLIVVCAVTICANAAVIQPRTGLLRVNTVANRTTPSFGINLGLVPKAGPHGLASCPCIGIDEIEGETQATLSDGSTAPYPADLGARCEAWDSTHHPKCKKGKESWCEAKWCYVDPCNCEGVTPLPKPANYLPDAKYQGKPVHFSYVTCDDMDSYTGKENKDSEKTRGQFEEIEKTCATPVDDAKWGHDNCRCVGIGGQTGTTKVNIDGKAVDFPADTGSTCHTWEADNHPECKGGSPPSWCNQAWCYVDPCKCKEAQPPKTSSYLPEANYQGKPVYYSYATCGGTDNWTASKHDKACVNQKTKEDCGKLAKCAWDAREGKNECLGKELVAVCAGAWSPKAIFAVALTLLSLIY